MSTDLTEKELIDLKEGLRRCSQETVDAAIHYRQHRDLEAIPVVVYGIIQRYQPATSTIRLSLANDETRLIEDLGLDSLTLLEIVLAIEEVLQVRIENEELKDVRTLGQLKQFLEHKIRGFKTAAPSRQYTREHLNLVMPQQPPFLFLDQAELNGEVVKAQYTITGEETFLEGHFKDDPVFPASIVFEAMGQAACLWVVEKAPRLLGRELKSNQVLFASLDGAHFYRKTRPGDRLEIEQRLLKLREPLAIFTGSVNVAGQRVAQIDRLVLAFGDIPQAETSPEAPQPAAGSADPHPPPAA